MPETKTIKHYKRNRIVILLAVILMLSILGYGGYFAYTLYHFTKDISTANISDTLVSEVPDTNQESDTSQIDTKQNDNKSDLNVEKKNLNILVVGIDSGNFRQWNGEEKQEQIRTDSGRTDTIMIVSINRKTNKVALLSIPRDTYVNIPGHGMDKINHAYAYGGIELSIKTVSQFLGVPIDNYIKVNYEAFVKLVDGLGGVTINVTEDVVFFYDGQVKVTKGVHKMDGKLAFDYVQVREGDIERVQRQQIFVKTLAEKALDFSTIPKIPGIMNSISSDIRTDMTTKEIVELTIDSRRLNLGQISNAIIPGHAATINGISYWLSDDQGTKQSIADTFN